MEGDRGREPGRTWGGRGTGDGRRKTRKSGKRDLNEGGKRARNSKKFLLLMIHSKHEANNIGMVGTTAKKCF